MATDNKRNFFRLLFSHPIGAEIKIIGHDDSDPDYKVFKTALVDISAGGARFYTVNPLPEEHNLLVEMKFTALGKDFRLLGTIVRSILPEPGHYEYCSQFSLDEADTTALTSMINALSIKLRKTPTPSGCSFCPAEELADFLPLTRTPR
ncbi:PilZ domain-containing protein [Paenibacillus cremeus]|uniref:PilZ domain-containing protein n=1 Tax=Paenibacillus cremeus TaxID=2163881 RepID=A0A559K3N5_9BACL|nr:PilZ domain-containing protein [Paenibacillus cremeus]TVY06717.1 PilZ domain-containing protein [Paenibacillus cremeus]